jgi:hypothetical protein
MSPFKSNVPALIVSCWAPVRFRLFITVIFPAEEIVYMLPAPTNSSVKKTGLVPVIVCTPAKFNRTDPLLCVNMPLVKATVLLSISRIAEVDVNAVPDNVKAPPIVMLAVPPVNVPPEKLAALTVVMEFVAWLMIPVYKAATVILLIDTGISIEQLPKPPLSKLTSSPTPGTEAPLAPPETADQLAILFQLEETAATQNRAAKELFEKLRHRNRTKQRLAIFMNI